MLNKKLGTLLLALSFSGSAFALGQAGKYLPYQKGSAENQSPLGFYLYLPQDYNPSNSTKYPLILFMHGIGEKGNGTTQLENVNKNGLALRIKNGFHLPAIVVSPQCCGSVGNWHAGTNKQLIDFIRSKLKVDNNRFYVTGLSWGGEGTINYGRAYPEEVAAMVPVAESQNPNSSLDVKMRGKPMWFFHNNPDNNYGGTPVRDPIGIINNITASTVDIKQGYPYPFINSAAEETKLPEVLSDMIMEYSESKKTHVWKKGNTATVFDPDITIRFTVYDAKSHNSWTKAYNDANMYTWMFKQSLSGLEPEPEPVNSAPVVVSVPAQVLEEEQSKTLVISASDKDGDAISMKVAGNLPSFAQFTDIGGGKANLVLAPRAGHAGSYSIVVEARDPDGAVGKTTIALTVKALPVPVDPDAMNALVDFGHVDLRQTSGTNIISQGSFIPLIDVNGQDVGDVKISGFNNINMDGTQTPAASLGLSANAARDSFFGNDKTFSGKIAPKGVLQISGLDPKKLYKLSFFASRMNVTNNRETLYLVKGQNQKSATLNVANNQSAMAIVSDIKPQANGDILVEVTKGPKNDDSYGFFYLGALKIEKLKDLVAPVITLKGANPLLLKQGTSFVDPGATALDNFDGDISSSIQKSGSVNTAVPGQYTISYQVKDAAGNIGKASRIVEVGSDQQIVLVDVGASNTSDPQANNITAQGVAVSLKDSFGIATGMRMTVSGFNSVNPDGTLSPTAAGISPAMSRDSLYGNTKVHNGKTAPLGLVTLTGLDPMKLYKLSFYASRMNVSNNRETLYNVKGLSQKSATLNVANNTSSMAVINEVRAKSDGSLQVEIQKGPNNNDSYSFFYLGALKIERLQDSSAPVITLKGANPLLLKQGASFVDPGATAVDNLDGDLSSAIKKSGTVNTAVVGSYTIAYEVRDAAGNVAKASRTVKVEAVASRVLIDVGASNTQDPKANNIVTQGSTVSLKDVNGLATSMKIVVTGFNNVNTNGTLSPTAPGITPEMSRDSFYGNTKTHNGKVATQGLVKLSGLDPAKSYKLSFYASRMSVSNNRQTMYSVSGATGYIAYLDVQNNTSNMAVVNAMKPDSAGVITIKIQKGPNNNDSYGFFYLGGMIIE